MLPLRALIIGAALLAGCTCVHVPPVAAACIGTTCGSSLTTYLDMCRLNQSCNRTDFIDNMNNNWITLDTKFAPTVGLEGHGHRGTDGDGPKLSPSSAFNCIDSPSDGETAVYDSTTGTCEWVPNAGSFGGDVSGPGSSTDNAMVCFDGVLGDTIKECGTDWLVDASNNLISSTGSIGIGDLTPDARLEVSDDFSPSNVPAALLTCTGAALAGVDNYVCQDIVNSSTATADATGITGLRITTTGTNTGLNSFNYGLIIEADNATNNNAISVLAGNVSVNNGQIANDGDTTPDADLDITQTSNTEEAILVTSAGKDANAVRVSTTGVAAGAHQAMVVANTKTGGSSGLIKSGMQVTSGGAWSGINTAILANATDGAEGNAAFLATAGSLQLFEGGVYAVTSGTDRAGDITCTGSPASCMRVDSSAMAGGDIGFEINAAGSDIYGLDILAAGSSGFATGFNIAATNANATATGLVIQATGQECRAQQLNVDCEADSGSCEGMVIDVDGNSSTIATGLTINVTDTADAESLRINSGNVMFGPGSSETFFWRASTGQVLINDSVAGSGTSALEVHNDGTKTTAIEVVSTGTGATTGSGITSDLTGAVTAASSGSVISNSQTSSTASINKVGLQVNSTGTWDGAGAINGAVQASATGGTSNYAFWALQGGYLGSTLTGGTASTNDLTLISNPSDDGRIILGDDITGTDSVVIHGTETGITIAGTAFTTRLAIHDQETAFAPMAGFHKHTNTAATGPSIEFARSRGTEASETVVSDNDILGRIAFLGFDGTDYERAASLTVEVDEGTPAASVMGGAIVLNTSSAGAAVPLERVRIDSAGITSITNLMRLVPTDAPTTCAAGIEGALYYDTSLNLLCICSDSDGGNFEWETVEDRTVTC